MKPKTMDQSRAESVAVDFAREHRLSINNPIVRDLERGMKMSLGAMRYRDRRKAEKDVMQPGLFPRKSSDVVEMKKAEG